MILLIIFLSIGFVLSVLLHLLQLFHIYSTPQWFIVLVNICAACAVYIAIMISKGLCNKYNIKESKKIIYALCPKWISTMTGFLIIYAIVGFLILIFKKYIEGPTTTNNDLGRNIKEFSGHWMALYALAISIVYSCKKYTDALKK